MKITQEEVKRYIDLEIAGGENLPLFSPVTHRALKLLKQDEVGIIELSNIILRDAALTASIIRVVNSPFYGFPRQISKIPEAISYIGLSDTKHIIYASIAHSLFGQGQSAKTWKHSVATAFIAEKISHHSSADPGEAYVAGLLHDIGKTFLQSRVAPRYYSVMASLENIDRDEVLGSEQRVLGYDHAQIGEMLLRRWNFSENLIQAVGSHHFAIQPDEVLCQVVALANQVAHQVNFPAATKSTILEPASLNHLDLDLDTATSTFYGSMDNINTFLERVSVLM